MNTQKVAAEALSFTLSDLCRKGWCDNCKDVAKCNHICHDAGRGDNDNAIQRFADALGSRHVEALVYDDRIEIAVTLRDGKTIKRFTVTGSCPGGDERHTSEAVTLTVSEVTL